MIQYQLVSSRGSERGGDVERKGCGEGKVERVVCTNAFVRGSMLYEIQEFTVDKRETGIESLSISGKGE